MGEPAWESGGRVEPVKNVDIKYIRKDEFDDVKNLLDRMANS